jgi:hypothetical protein
MIKVGYGVSRTFRPRKDGIARDWLSFNGGQDAPKNGVEPGMFMKNKQVSEKSTRCSGPLPKTKYLKLNRLSILNVGYHGAEKCERK